MLVVPVLPQAAVHRRERETAHLADLLLMCPVPGREQLSRAADL